MTPVFRYGHARARLLVAGRNRALSLKAVAFGLVGVVNTVVDYCVFLLARAAFDSSAAALAAFASLSVFCDCGSTATFALIAVHTVAWLVAMSGSFVMNSFVTFAAETGRKLRWRAYFAFAGSGIAGWITNTATLLVLAQILLLPALIVQAAALLGGCV